MNQRRDDPAADGPPHSIEMEQVLLGALFRKSNFDAIAASKLEPNDFFEGVHQSIFAEIARRHERAEPATPLTVRGAFAPDLIIEGLPIGQYLARLAAAEDPPNHVPHLADTIKQYAASRAHVRLAQDLTDHRQYGIAIDEALRIFHDESEAIRTGYLGPGLRDTSCSMADVVYAVNERMTGAVNGDPTTLGIPTSLVNLDKLIGGLRRGNFGGGRRQARHG